MKAKDKYKRKTILSSNRSELLTPNIIHIHSSLKFLEAKNATKMLELKKFEYTIHVAPSITIKKIGLQFTIQPEKYIQIFFESPKNYSQNLPVP